MRIITNTGSLITPEEGREAGITVLPEYVTIGNRSYRDYFDIDTDKFLLLLENGNIPVTAQPSFGEMLDLLEMPQEDTILLTIADGLSGEYETALGIRNSQLHKERIHVVNSGSLGGPLRYLTKKAAQLRDQGMPAAEIAEKLRGHVQKSISYVIPADFSYLNRSGRITRLTSKIGEALRLLPILTQSEDRKRIIPVGVKRTWKSAVDMIIHRLSIGVSGAGHLLSVGYADTKERAVQISRQLWDRFPDAEIELLRLSPSLVTHGGPGCIVIQAVEMIG